MCKLIELYSYSYTGVFLRCLYDRVIYHQLSDSFMMIIRTLEIAATIIDNPWDCH